MRALVIGAGAVGVAYGAALKCGGAHVTFMVRDKYLDATRRGIRVYRAARDVGEVLVPDDVVTVVHADYDQIWVCVPTTGVTPELLHALVHDTGAATIVDLSADADSRIRVAVGDERSVEGSVVLIAYQTPLPGVPSEHAREPGVRVYTPPLAATPLAGARAPQCAAALNAGRLRARAVANVGISRAMASSLFNTIIAHLELSGWSLAGLRTRIDGAPAQALQVSAAALRLKPPLLFRVATQPWVLRIAAHLAPVFISIPLQPYLQFHFTKVGAQTRQSLAVLVAKADRAGADAPALRALALALPAHR